MKSHPGKRKWGGPGLKTRAPPPPPARGAAGKPDKKKNHGAPE